MEENNLVKYRGGELERIGNSIAITNKLLSQRNDLKVLVIWNDVMMVNLIQYNLQLRDGFEIDEATIDEADYETALVKSKQKKYDVVLITTMLNALKLTSKLREDNNYKNALIYILSQDRNFCAKDPKEYNVTGFLVKDDFFIGPLFELMEQIRDRFNK